MSIKLWTRFVRWWAHGALLCLAVSNTILLYYNGQLHVRHNELVAEIRRLRAPDIKSQAKPISGTDLSGNPVYVDLSTAKPNGTLIFVLSPYCRVCDANWHNWEKLGETAGRLGISTMFLDLSGMISDEYLRDHGIQPSSLITRLSDRTFLDYRFGLTPSTIFVSARGIVESAWVGYLDVSDMSEIERLFGSTD